MKYCIVDSNNIITNIIICDNDESAAALGAVIGYDSARIGDVYDPYNYYALEKLQRKIEDQEILINTLTGVTE